MSDAIPSLGDVFGGAGSLLAGQLGLAGTFEESVAAREPLEALAEQQAELEADRLEREEEIQKEIEKRNAERERVLSRGRGYGGTILTSGLDSSTLDVKRKKLGVG